MTRRSTRRSVPGKVKNSFNNNTGVVEGQVSGAKPFECALCPTVRFSTSEELEGHVKKKHASPKSAKTNATKTLTEEVIDEVADEFASEVEALEAAKQERQEKRQRRPKPSVPRSPTKPHERNWQECPDRNWAAEFGYSGKRTIGSTMDILSKMRFNFKATSADDDEDEEVGNGNPGSGSVGYDSGVGIDDEDKVYRMRGFKGTIKASPNKAPRTLSNSSLRTRKRMEALMRRAREFMRQEKKAREAKEAAVVQPAVSELRPTTNAASLDLDQASAGPSSLDQSKPNDPIMAAQPASASDTETVDCEGKEQEGIPEAKSTPPTSNKSASNATARTQRKGSDKRPSVTMALSTRSSRRRKPSGFEPGRGLQDEDNAQGTSKSPPQPSSSKKDTKQPTAVATTAKALPAASVEKPEETRQRITLTISIPPRPEVINDPGDDDEDCDDDEFFDDLDGIVDEDDDDDTDGLLIPLENGWVCEKRLTDPDTRHYSTHFWSPDGVRHSSLSVIKAYGTKKKLKLNMAIFERALANNPGMASK